MCTNLFIWHLATSTARQARRLTTLLVSALLMSMLPLKAASQEIDIYFVHADHLGTPKILTDEVGTVVWAAEYRPFGILSLQVVYVTNNIRFPGQYFDAETGQHYNYFRDYDPTTGRYAQSDPIGLNAGVNTYSYVAGNPIVSFDPYGLLAGDPATYTATSEAIAAATGVSLGALVASVVGGITMMAYSPALNEGADEVYLPGPPEFGGGGTCPPDEFCKRLLEIIRNVDRHIERAMIKRPFKSMSLPMRLDTLSLMRAVNELKELYEKRCGELQGADWYKYPLREFNSGPLNESPQETPQRAPPLKVVE